MTDTLEVTGPMAILMAMIDESDDSLTLDSFTEDAQEAIQKMKEDGLIIRSPLIALTDKGFDTLAEHPAYQKMIRHWARTRSGHEKLSGQEGAP